jgi:hypothetical protein
MTRSMKLTALVEAVHAAKTHHEKAALEAKIHPLMMDARTQNKTFKTAYRAKLKELGLNQCQFEKHRYITNSKSEYAWKLLDTEHLTLATVYLLVRKAKKIALEKSCTLDEAVEKELKQISSRKHSVNNGGVFFRKASTHNDLVKKSWCKIHEAIKMLVSVEFKHLDRIEHVKFERSFESDIQALLHQYKIRANSSVKNGLRAESPSLRRHFLEALDEIGIARPGRGQVVNQKYANQLRAAHRRRAGESHPDRHPGNDHMAQKFIRINKAYEVVEQYLSAQGVNT